MCALLSLSISILVHSRVNFGISLNVDQLLRDLQLAYLIISNRSTLVHLITTQGRKCEYAHSDSILHVCTQYSQCVRGVCTRNIYLNVLHSNCIQSNPGSFTYCIIIFQKSFTFQTSVNQIYWYQHTNIRFCNFKGVLSFGHSVPKQQQLHKQVCLLSKWKLIIK